jgi:hypothetical protein
MSDIPIDVTLTKIAGYRFSEKLGGEWRGHAIERLVVRLVGQTMMSVICRQVNIVG